MEDRQRDDGKQQQAKISKYLFSECKVEQCTYNPSKIMKLISSLIIGVAHPGANSAIL